MTRLEKDLAALATMLPAQLREKWTVLVADPPPTLPTRLFRQLVAHKLQERRHGRLSSVIVRELDRSLTGDASTEARPRPMMTPGTRLIREWNGRTIAVVVRDEGFVWDDRTYRSLSEIAREVTGAHWSGPRFFGLHRRG